ncbi:MULTISPECIES: response regulator transcription factor [unclassified Brachybacterium]|uniref:response regulator transcription factor n=1 Tax=unclassified Brachybacterium TaxID=2623841 RepID=UPI000C7FBC0D|nr:MULTISPECIES: response regulator transcription factor [unclassified Brachybacterium]PMC76363.1 DNA-binding response regulator [Brachybacterium sp. UMB0905]
MTAEPTTVLICDDDPIVREALGSYIDREEDLAVTASAGTAEEALRLLDEQAVDVVLMDHGLPGMNGIDATRLVRSRHHGTAVVMLTTFGDEEQVGEAISAGASGYLLKSTSPSALAAAVRAAGAHAGTVLTPDLAARLTAQPLAPTHPAPTRTDPAELAELGLTEREADVLALLCAAESNAGIARALSLSESTVKSHVSSLMTKLECTSRLQIALTAFERGLAVPPGPEGE